MLQCPLFLFRRDERQRRISAHSTGIRSFVSIISALMVLAQRHWINAIVMHKSHEGKLRSLEKILYYHFAFAERFAYQHVTQCIRCFLLILRDNNTFACCQAIVFEHRRIRISRTYILHSLVIIGKTAVCRCRHVIFRHQFFGKLLAGFNLCSRL